MSQNNQLSDENLIQSLKKGDHGAFVAIYERYKGVLYLHAFRKLRDEDDADDLLHDLFAALWAKREELEIQSSLSSYLYKAVHNRVLDRITHQQVVDRYVTAFRQYMIQPVQLTDSLTRERELRCIIEAEVANLPAKMRVVFELSRFHHLSHKEIAARLGVTEKTVKNQVGNALKILKEKLGPLVILLFTLYR